MSSVESFQELSEKIAVVILPTLTKFRLQGEEKTGVFHFSYLSLSFLRKIFCKPGNKFIEKPSNFGKLWQKANE